MTVEEFLAKQKTDPDLRVEIELRNLGGRQLFVVDRANEICAWFNVLSIADAYTIIIRLNRDNKRPVDLERHGEGARMLLNEARWDREARLRFIQE